MKQTDSDHFTLSSGRKFYSNFGIIGIGPECDGITEGYDGGVDGADLDGNWTEQERVELANEMIRRWTTYRDFATQGKE